MASGPGTPKGQSRAPSSHSLHVDKNVPSYRRDLTGESATETLARDIVKRRSQIEESRRILKGNYRNGRWFDAAGRFVGTARNEVAPIKFVRPRRLGQRGQS